MYFMIKDENDKTICEVGIYSEEGPYKMTNEKYWYHKMYVSFNIETYSNYLIEHINRAEEIKNIFTEIQGYVLDLNEGISGDYPERKQYLLNDPEMNESKFQIIKVTRDRLYSVIEKLGDTGIYINED